MGAGPTPTSITLHALPSELNMFVYEREQQAQPCTVDPEAWAVQEVASSSDSDTPNSAHMETPPAPGSSAIVGAAAHAVVSSALCCYWGVDYMRALHAWVASLTWPPEPVDRDPDFNLINCGPIFRITTQETAPVNTGTKNVPVYKTRRHCMAALHLAFVKAVEKLPPRPSPQPSATPCSDPFAVLKPEYISTQSWPLQIDLQEFSHILL